MKIEKTNAQMRKGVLELCVLSVISDQEVYTSDILSALKDAQLLVVEGTVYPLLTRLKNDGILKYRWEESTSGPPRKYYSLTEQGIETLNSLTENWKQLNKSVQQLLKPKKS
ncbi:MAG: PadR family transcriptional regulator [Marinilabiliales bacterium]|jgi:PadR family transcriptional regulator PadR|nr:MAG: PadR family transcriptional regulator [Marinilabiliales bacterium]